MTETTILVFLAGLSIGAYAATKIVSARARRLLHIRGEALRKITNHKWDTGEHSDAVVITKIALTGLEHKHKGMRK